jgi:hypothetical protein
MDFVLAVTMLSAHDLLTWGGNDWPQPRPVTGIGRLDWDTQSIAGPRPVSCADEQRVFFEGYVAPMMERAGWTFQDVFAKRGE